MENPFQVVVAGGGPGGLRLARDLARAGIRVGLYEAAAPDHWGHTWSDAVEQLALADAGFELPKRKNGTWTGPMVKKEALEDNLFEPHAMEALEIRTPDLSGRTRSNVVFDYITTDRIALDRELRRQALAAGARLFFRHRVDGLIGRLNGPLEKIAVEGIRVTDLAQQRSEEIRADVTVDATGYRSRLRTALAEEPAIGRPYSGGDLAWVYRTVRRMDPGLVQGQDITDHYRYGAFRGYFWTHRHNATTIDVGGGVREAPDRVDPRAIVEEMIRQRPYITREEIRGGGGTVLVARSPYTLVARGFLAVGDAAGQVIPTTGCGVGGALVGAGLASKTLIDALTAGNNGLDALWPYNRGWFTGPGRGDHFAALAALKEILQRLSHEDLAFLMHRDILSGEMLTPSINGIFFQPDLKTAVSTLVRGISRPGLLWQLNKATAMGKKIFRHYRAYPPVWNASAFAAWQNKAESLFKRVTGQH